MRSRFRCLSNCVFFLLIALTLSIRRLPLRESAWHSEVDYSSAIGAYSNFSVINDDQDSRRLFSIGHSDNVDRVHSLPGLSTATKHYAGHINIDKDKGSNIFYWLFEAPKDAKKLPLLVWMNGGPGCSSMDGLFLELGPLRLANKGSSIHINPFSWHNVANLLFIDQPVGTGLSYTKSKTGYAKNDDMVNGHFHKFLVKFLRLHPEYLHPPKLGSAEPTTTRDFFLSGESHAGHYIPSMAAHILKMNGKAGADDISISIKGIALGNPWFDPFHQYDASEFAHGMGIINDGQKNKLKELERKCRANLSSGKFNTQVCFSLLDNIVDASTVGGSQKVLMYDARKFVYKTTSFPPGHEAVEGYLNRADVRKAINAAGTPHKFLECSNPPFYALSHQDGKGVTREFATVLNAGLRVLVYAGQFDMICNHLGIERALGQLQWEGREDWLRAQPGVWVLDKKPAGYIRSFKNLQYLLVLNSGHMLPMDQPKIAMIMIQNFLQDKSFRTGPSKIGVSLDAPSHCNTQSASAATAANQVAHHHRHLNKTQSFHGRSIATKSRPNTALAKTQTGRKRRKVLNGSLWSRTNNKPDVVAGANVVRGGSGSAERDEQNNINDSNGINDINDAGASAASASTSYHLNIAHVTPLESALHVRLKLQHEAGLAPHHNHHAHATNAAATLAHQHFEVRLQPGGREVAVDMDELQRSGWVGCDLVVESLEAGVEYALTVMRVDALGQAFVSSRRSVTARPGCYVPHMTQCCSRGECLPVVTAATDAPHKTSGAAYCRCDAGYSGNFCDYYELQVGPGIVSNISGSDRLCPAHFAQPAQSHIATAGSSKSGTVLTQGSDKHHHTEHHKALLISTPRDELSQLTYCSSSEGGSSNSKCCVSFEFVLQPRSAAIWLAAGNVEEYLNHINAVLAMDVKLSVLGGVKQQNIFSVVARLGQLPSADLQDVEVVLNRSLNHHAEAHLSPHANHHQQHHHQHHSHTDGLSPMTFATVEMCGRGGDVQTAASSIALGLADSSSLLRGGLVSTHLRPHHCIVVNHKNPDRLLLAGSSSQHVAIGKKSRALSWADLALVEDSENSEVEYLQSWSQVEEGDNADSAVYPADAVNGCMHLRAFFVNSSSSCGGSYVWVLAPLMLLLLAVFVLSIAHNLQPKSINAAVHPQAQISL